MTAPPEAMPMNAPSEVAPPAPTKELPVKPVPAPVDPNLCAPTTTIEEAMREIPSSLVPISGLRRDESGNLSPDALGMITDGLKSRGIDPTDSAQKQTILKELDVLLCSVNNQYQFLLAELSRRLNAGEPIEVSYLEMARQKNLFMLDILNVSRHLSGQQTFDQTKTFIEGWQVRGSSTGYRIHETDSISAFTTQLDAEREMLESRSLSKLKRQSYAISQEKNRAANASLGLYGFMNIVAIGLLLYVAGVSNK